MIINELKESENVTGEIIPEIHWIDIQQGLKDIANGDFMTLEEFEKRYEKYLKD